MSYLLGCLKNTCELKHWVYSQFHFRVGFAKFPTEGGDWRVAWLIDFEPKSDTPNSKSENWPEAKKVELIRLQPGYIDFHQFVNAKVDSGARIIIFQLRKILLMS